MKFHIELVSKSSGRMGVLQKVGNRIELVQGESGIAAHADRRVGGGGGVPDDAGQVPDQGLRGVGGFQIKTPAVIMSTKVSWNIISILSPSNLNQLLLVRKSSVRLEGGV